MSSARPLIATAMALFLFLPTSCSTGEGTPDEDVAALERRIKDLEEQLTAASTSTDTALGLSPGSTEDSSLSAAAEIREGSSIPSSSTTRSPSANASSAGRMPPSEPSNPPAIPASPATSALITTPATQATITTVEPARPSSTLRPPTTPAVTPELEYSPTLDCDLSLDPNLSAGKVSYRLDLAETDYRGRPLPPRGSAVWDWIARTFYLKYPVKIQSYVNVWVFRPSFYNEEGLWQPSEYLLKWNSPFRTDYWSHSPISVTATFGPLDLLPGDEVTVFLYSGNELLDCNPIAKRTQP